MSSQLDSQQRVRPVKGEMCDWLTPHGSITKAAEANIAHQPSRVVNTTIPKAQRKLRVMTRSYLRWRLCQWRPRSTCRVRRWKYDQEWKTRNGRCIFIFSWPIIRSFYIFSPFSRDQYFLILRGRKIILQVRHHHFLLSKV